MVGVKTIAALVSMANGIWTVIAGAYWASIFPNSGDVVSVPFQEYSLAVLTFGVILLLDSVVCLLGWSRAFYASAGISLLVVLWEVLFRGGAPVLVAFIGGIALAALTIGLDVVAARTRDVIAEEDHPLNLPVFG
jgi:hypothetical protein